MSFITKVNVEELRKNVFEAALNSGLTELEVEEKVNKFASEFREDGVEEEDAEIKALRRLLASLRRRSVRNLTTLNGIIFAKTRTKDFGKKYRENAKRIVEEKGIEFAKENGYVNEEGKALYKDDPYNTGVVPADTRMASFIGFFENSEGEGDIYEVFIGFKENTGLNQIDEEIPLFKKVSLVVAEGRKTQLEFGTKKMYLDSFDGISESSIDIRAFAEFLLDRFENKVKKFSSISRVADQIDNNDWIITEGSVVNTGLISDDSDVVRHDIMNIIPNDEDDTLVFWVDKTILNGLGRIDGEDVLLIMKPYVKRDGTISGNIYGILPENIKE